MTDPRHHLIDRRTLLTEFGRGAVGLAVFGGTALTLAPPSAAAATSSKAPATKWARANLGFVSAYVLARGKEAAVIDTGVSGSEAAIEKAVRSLGLRWSNVRHVIVTHAHPDHMGSVPGVLQKATRATAAAGALDAPNVRAPRPVRALDDGEELFGLTIVGTPGHTPGHIAVLEPVSGVLLCGDAMRTGGGAVLPPEPRFTADLDMALDSVVKVAELQFETLLPGHGEPITKSASKLVAELAKR
jgi:glyoxylase-like metal-dependent hydrolase (beta-lactamase superfamily II)